MKTAACVRVTVVVKLHQPWPADTTVDVILKAAKREALERVQNLVQEGSSSVSILDATLVNISLYEETESK